MSNVLVDQASLQDIADAIRSKLGIQDTYKPSEMADAIESISGGGITPTGTKQINVTQNGTVTEDVTSYASAEINVNVPQPTGTMTITENGTYDVTNYASADVSVSGGGGSGYEFEWATTTNQVVTIGANSVTNTQSAKDFFDAYASYNMCILLSPLTDENQFVYCGTSGAMRYRNGAIASTNIGSAYDTKLVEGTKYLLIGK